MTIQIVYTGDRKETAFGDLKFPLLPGLEKVIGDQLVNRAGIVPVRYAKGKTEFMQIDTMNQEVYDFHLQLHGTKEEVVANIEHLVPFFEAALAPLGDEYHVVQRILYSDNPDYPPRSVPRVMVIRVYKTNEFPCVEHPEMLAGEPLGTYHCPFCLHNQMAGLPHINDEDMVNAQAH